jgi:hypothetical protein
MIYYLRLSAQYVERCSSVIGLSTYITIRSIRTPPPYVSPKIVVSTKTGSTESIETTDSIESIDSFNMACENMSDSNVSSPTRSDNGEDSHVFADPNPMRVPSKTKMMKRIRFNRRVRKRIMGFSLIGLKRRMGTHLPRLKRR